MPLEKRHKYILTALAFYWPAIFVLTHMPLPRDVHKLGMSDKTMHFLAYLALVSLAWLSVSPSEKVNWRKAKVWIILAAVVWYGAMDEWLQSFVGRSADIRDFYANIAASLTALLIFTFFTFWPGILALATIAIFSITCLTRVNIVFLSEITNSAFYFLAYSFFTLVWIQCSQRAWSLKKSEGKWLASSILVPLAVLSAMMLAAGTVFGKKIWYMDILTAFSAIALTVATSYIICKTTVKKRKPKAP